MLTTKPNAVIVNPVTGQRLEILEHTPERLVMDATVVSPDKRPPLHHHPFQDERFEVLEGWVDFTIGKETVRKHAGDVVEIPRNTTHEMSGDGRVRWEIAPALRTAELFAEVFPLGQPDLLTGAAIVNRYHDEFRLSGFPWPLQRVFLAAAALIRR